MAELYVKYRPQVCDDILGNDLAIKSVRSEIKADHHVFLFTGASGCGKSTLAFAVAKELGATELTTHYINASDDRGIGTVRQIKEEIRYQPLVDGKSVYILDEVHGTTKEFQESLLMLLEDNCPSWVYFILATTNPEKLLDTIKTRCSRIELKPLDDITMFKLLRKVAHEEQVQVSVDVLRKVAGLAEGSSRKGLKLLGQILYLNTDEERMEYLDKNTFSDENQDIIELCRALIAKKGWNAYMECLDKAKDDVKANPEGVKFLVMSYARSVLKKSFNINAAAMLKAFCSVDTWRNKEYALIEGIIEFMELTGD